jgi:hypothetical protein
MTTASLPTLGARRVVRRTETRRTEGYTCHDRVEVNVLQTYTGRLGSLFPHWMDTDFEDVPAHVAISVGCFGDTGGWRSRFADLDGVDFPSRDTLDAQRWMDARSDIGFVLTASAIALVCVALAQRVFGIS